MYPIHHQLRKLLSDFPQEFSFSGQMQQGQNLPMRPPVNIKESEEGFEMQVVLPGFSKEQVEIQLEDQFLMVTAETPQSSEEKDHYLTREIKTGIWKRRFRLGNQCQTDGIQASMENGILTVFIPKQKSEEPAKSRIPIQ